LEKMGRQDAGPFLCAKCGTTGDANFSKGGRIIAPQAAEYAWAHKISFAVRRRRGNRASGKKSIRLLSVQVE
jgi:hypothetical protein